MTEKKIEIMGIHLFVKAVGIKPLASTTRIRVYTIQYWSWESRLRSRVTVQCNKVHYNTPPPPPRERPFYYTTLRATEWVHHHLESDRMSTPPPWEQQNVLNPLWATVLYLSATLSPLKGQCLEIHTPQICKISEKYLQNLYLNLKVF